MKTTHLGNDRYIIEFDATALPVTVDALIDLIDHQFPLKNLAPGTPHDDIHRMFGARDVVDFLRSLQKERDELAREPS